MIGRVRRRADPRGPPGGGAPVHPRRRICDFRGRSRLARTADSPGAPPFYDRLVKWFAARSAAIPPWLQDTILAVLLAAVNVAVTAVPYAHQLRPAASGVPALVAAHPEATAVVLLAVQALPLAGRRFW